MKTDHLEELFNGLDFDQAEPSADHQEKFLKKLQNRSRKKTKKSSVISLWVPALSVAASLLVGFLLLSQFGGFQHSGAKDLAHVSPEMKQTQDFYSAAIQTELEVLRQQRSPETEGVIEDALKQLAVLEADYQKLKKDLGTSGQDQRVIYAMISNFQQRIDLLKNVLEKVNTINNLKNNPDENNII